MTTDVVLLHGWPGLPSDWDEVRSALGPTYNAIAPDLDGFGAAFVPGRAVDARAETHADTIIELIRDRGLDRPVIAGYDIGSRIAQTIARRVPDLISGIVISPGYPGVAPYTQAPEIQPAYWYQHFHRLPLSVELLDGNRGALHTYLGYFWRQWSRRDDLATGPRFEAIVDSYARPGAFAASIAWYSANQGYAATDPVTVATVMLWGEHDLFPVAWSDRLDDWFTEVELRVLPGCGHFLPLEAPAPVVAAIEAIAQMT
jgi:pimeloyl-ACP methyl ester carboxylesterase